MPPAQLSALRAVRLRNACACMHTMYVSIQQGRALCDQATSTLRMHGAHVQAWCACEHHVVTALCMHGAHVNNKCPHAVRLSSYHNAACKRVHAG